MRLSWLCLAACVLYLMPILFFCIECLDTRSSNDRKIPNAQLISIPNSRWIELGGLPYNS